MLLVNACQACFSFFFSLPSWPFLFDPCLFQVYALFYFILSRFLLGMLFRHRNLPSHLFFFFSPVLAFFIWPLPFSKSTPFFCFILSRFLLGMRFRHRNLPSQITARHASRHDIQVRSLSRYEMRPGGNFVCVRERERALTENRGGVKFEGVTVLWCNNNKILTTNKNPSVNFGQLVFF